MKLRSVIIAMAVGAMAAPAALAAGPHDGTTVGDCISDGFYGNEPNMADGSAGGPAQQAPGTQAGNVLPTQSPGPFRTDPATGEVYRGNSIGYYNSMGINIPQSCAALTRQ